MSAQIIPFPELQTSEDDYLDFYRAPPLRKRPARQPAPFDTIIVHSFSRFFRDQFQLEFYVRRLAKNGIRLTSITQDLGDDPMSVMMRQITMESINEFARLAR